MKQLIINVVLVAVGLGVSLAAGTCEAADTDMREGSFEGNWCGFSARFDIEKRVGNTWKFTGKILIKSTQQYDDFTVEQLGDNSLYMVRTLSGNRAGQTQAMQTHPPEILSKAGKLTVNFPARRTYGFGAKLLGFLRMPQK